MRLSSSPVRRGSAYVFVLGVASMVTLLGLSALAVARLGAAGDDVSRDWRDAQALAALGIDLALETINGYGDTAPDTWRDTIAKRGTAGTGAFDGGAFAWTISDASGAPDLRDRPEGDLLLTSTGTRGDARHVISVRLAPGPGTTTPMPCFGSAMHAGESVRILEATVTSDGMITSNGTIQCGGGGSVEADVSAAGSVLGGAYLGATNTGATALELPGPRVVEYLRTYGTVIDSALLDVSGGATPTLDIRGVLLSPAANPFGVPNESGIYIIDCDGANLTISGCRIVGTLVLVEPGMGSAITGNVNWEPAIPDYPALVVDGSMRIALMTTSALEEKEPAGIAGDVNFNPPDTPYDGVDDGDKGDRYPNVIGGIVYATQDLTFEGATIEGTVIVGGTLTILREPLTVLYRYAGASPMPGFTTQIHDGYPLVIDGSWRQVVSAPTD